MPEDVLELIANFANGDARTALSTLEMVALNGEAEGGYRHCLPGDSGAVYFQEVAALR